MAKPTFDFETAVLQHGAIPIVDARGHVVMIGHDGTAHGYLLDKKTQRRLVVPTKRSTEDRTKIAHHHNELIGMHQEAHRVHAGKRKEYDKRRLDATHRMIHTVRGD